MPNQHTLNLHARKYRVLAYLHAHPGCTTFDVAAHFGIDQPFISMDLHHLRRQGSAYSEKKEGVRLVRWFAIEEDSKEEYAVESQQVTVSKTWKPHRARCPLVAALFGAGPAQVAA